jgi:SAM-dependent methyltransferase
MDPTQRFSDRVENYIKYRPGYPAQVVTYLHDECNLSDDSVIADIGSGTGIFTKLLVNRGYRVYAVEPNTAMQQAIRQQLGAHANFIPVNGSAEVTTLEAKTIDLIVCAQAFHWFNKGETRLEFKRILKDDGYVALIWNNRDANADDFSTAYENILKKDSPDYKQVNHRNINETDLKAFFRDGIFKEVRYPNMQVFDEAGFLGRAFSSSYVPAEGTHAGEKFREALKAIFREYNKGGKVSFQYQTEVFLGKL